MANSRNLARETDLEYFPEQHSATGEARRETANQGQPDWRPLWGRKTSYTDKGTPEDPLAEAGLEALRSWMKENPY
jgi:hypothetical protein